jgi:Leucine-rich repeat (LRR) protein
LKKITPIDQPYYFKGVHLGILDLRETQLEEGFFKGLVIDELILPSSIRESSQIETIYDAKIKSLDLSETQVEILWGSCLKGSGIEKIKLPKCLKRINWNALAHTSNLKRLDLSETKVEELYSYCLDSSGIEELRLPKCLKRIEENALDGTVKLKSIDLSETKIEEIPQELIESKDVKLPKREGNDNSIKITVEEALKISSQESVDDDNFGDF